MKHNSLTYSFLRVFSLSLAMICITQGYSLLFAENSSSKNIQNENAEIFQSAKSSDFGSIGVAISTRIWSQFQQKNQTSFWNTQSFYREISSVGKSPQENRAIRSDMIQQNMIIIEEYLNLSRTNVKDLLKWSKNRSSTLTGFISQLEMRYKNSALSISALQKQKTLLLGRIEVLETQIEQVKTRMETNFSEWQSEATLKNVDDYFVLRAEYTEAFTDIVFINQFLKQHAFLNEYNVWVLDTLINNKEAIINQSYVVIPDSGSEFLRPLELLFDEAEIKGRVE